jgi:hypothetical protein
MMERRQYLKHHEHRADGDQGCSEGIAALHGANQRTHRDREQSW